MKPKSIRSALPVCFRFAAAALTAAAASASEITRPDPVPVHWPETLQATDGSYQRCLVFRTVPGVVYTVEASNNLLSWAPVTGIYGLGHDVAMPMFQTTAPPPPPSGPPPPPPVSLASIKLVSLRMVPADDPEGGTVVSWPSLTGSGSVVCRIPETLTAAWNGVPLYAEQFGAWYFFVSHPPYPLVPPEENPELTGDDAAMLASLRENLPTMNTQVATSVERARNTPPPAPPDPNSRRFWRIKADWSKDTDRDGSPDWLEHLKAGTPPYPPYQPGVWILRPDPDMSDTDRDGTPDGYQFDSDGDGTADPWDADPGDMDLGASDPLWRYAVFPVTASASLHGAPLMINSRGTVLFRAGYWANGALNPLELENEGEVGSCGALAIDDADRILGHGIALRQPTGGSGGQGGGSTTSPLVLSWWTTPDGLPVPVEADGTFALPIIRVMEQVDSPSATFPHDSLLSATEGLFMANRKPASGSATAREIWQSSGSGFVRYPDTEGNFTVSGYDPLFIDDGMRVVGPCSGGSRMVIPLATPAHDFAFEVLRTPVLATLDEVRVHALGLNARPQVHETVGGASGWRDVPPFAGTTDMSYRGVRQTSLGGPGGTGGLAQDIRTFPLARWAPGLPADEENENINLSDNGWSLTRLSGGGCQASMPVLLEDEQEASGVDSFSLSGRSWNPPAFGFQEKSWVMAPVGGPANSFRLRSNAGPDTPLTVDAAGLQFHHGSSSLESLSPICSTSLQAAWPSSLYSGEEKDLIITYGTTASASQPLAAKAMHRRTVKVALYRVTKQTPGQPDNPPDLVPEAEFAAFAAALETELDGIFAPQVNAVFEVAPAGSMAVNWDLPDGNTPPNGTLKTLNEGDPHDLEPDPNPTAEQRVMLDAASPADGAHIRVFIMGTATGLDEAYGVTMRINPEKDPAKAGTDNACWIVGDPLVGGYGPFTPERARKTAAHEIGHVLIGLGHPDDGSGPAPLPGTNHSKRLMASGAFRNRGNFLVKAEWDKAEKWLYQNIKIDEE